MPVLRQEGAVVREALTSRFIPASPDPTHPAFGRKPYQPLWHDAAGELHWIQCLAVWAPDDWHWKDPRYFRFIIEASWADLGGPRCSIVAIAHGEMIGNFIAAPRMLDIRKAPVEPGTELVVYRNIPDNTIWIRPLAEWLEQIGTGGEARPRFAEWRPKPFTYEGRGR